MYLDKRQAVRQALTIDPTPDSTDVTQGQHLICAHFPRRGQAGAFPASEKSLLQKEVEISPSDMIAPLGLYN